MRQIMKNNCGAVFATSADVSHLFNFYYVKKRELKDGNCKWDICVEPKKKLTEDSYFVLEHFTGDEAEVELRLREILGDDWFGVVRWCDEDIKGTLAEKGYALTEENVAKVRDALDSGFREAMVQAGWDHIEYVVDFIVEDLEEEDD